MDLNSNKGYLLLESMITLGISLVILSSLSSSLIHLGKMITTLQNHISTNSEFIAQSMALEQLITHSQTHEIKNSTLTLTFLNQQPIQILYIEPTVYLTHGGSGKRRFIDNVNSFKIISFDETNHHLEIKGTHLNVTIPI